MRENAWHGTLLTDKGDGSGLNYRRNRYYDPASGRFTQEDPIGLAGGLNLYGFAEGDPVNYSDPYGLKVCYKGTPAEINRLHAATEAAIGAAVYLDAQKCIRAVGNPHEPRAPGSAQPAGPAAYPAQRVQCGVPLQRRSHR